MVYSNGYVVSIFSQGKPLSENKDHSVRVQINSEYSIKLFNKTDRRALARIYIDDENVSAGGYVIGAHSCVEIERFNSINKKFKLVAINSKEARNAGKGHRNDGANGVIKVEFFPEKPNKPLIPVDWKIYEYPYIPRKSWPQTEPIKYGDITCVSANHSKVMSNYGPESPGIESVTVKGSESSQKFYETSIDVEAISTTIVLKLVGQKEPLIAKRQYCIKCGKKILRHANFCCVCGTRL